MFKNIYDDVEKGDGDVKSGYGFLNSHTLSQREYSGIFNNIGGGVYKGDFNSAYGYMNVHTDSEQNNLVLFMKDNDKIDTGMNETLYNVDMSSVIGLLNSHTLLQAN